MNSYANANKKDFFYIIVLILTIITFIIGMTFAIYTWFFSHEEGSSAVYTGTLSIEYLSGNIIDFNLLYPVEKPSFNTVDRIYRNNFRVKNSGSLTGVLDIKIEIDKNEFSLDSLKYILFNSVGEELSTGNLDGVDDISIASNIMIDGNTTEEYVLVVWLNETHELQNDEMEKNFVGTIQLNAVQKKD